jgi:hypothetical protein
MSASLLHKNFGIIRVIKGRIHKTHEQITAEKFSRTDQMMVSVLSPINVSQGDQEIFRADLHETSTELLNLVM